MTDIGKAFKDMKGVDYFCIWCSHKFKHAVVRTADIQSKNTISDQVKCPFCGNFLKNK